MFITKAIAGIKRSISDAERISRLELAVAQQWFSLHQLTRYAELPKALTDYRTPEEIAKLVQLVEVR